MDIDPSRAVLEGIIDGPEIDCALSMTEGGHHHE
jgi:hypothetical protein